MVRCNHNLFGVLCENNGWANQMTRHNIKDKTRTQLGRKHINLTNLQFDNEQKLNDFII